MTEPGPQNTKMSKASPSPAVGMGMSPWRGGGLELVLSISSPPNPVP